MYTFKSATFILDVLVRPTLILTTDAHSVSIQIKLLSSYYLVMMFVCLFVCEIKWNIISFFVCICVLFFPNYFMPFSNLWRSLDLRDGMTSHATATLPIPRNENHCMGTRFAEWVKVEMCCILDRNVKAFCGWSFSDKVSFVCPWLSLTDISSFLWILSLCGNQLKTFSRATPDHDDHAVHLRSKSFELDRLACSNSYPHGLKVVQMPFPA